MSYVVCCVQQNISRRKIGKHHVSREFCIGTMAQLNNQKSCMHTVHRSEKGKLREKERDKWRVIINLDNWFNSEIRLARPLFLRKKNIRIFCNFYFYFYLKREKICTCKKYFVILSRVCWLLTWLLEWVSECVVIVHKKENGKTCSENMLFMGISCCIACFSNCSVFFMVLCFAVVC